MGGRIAAQQRGDLVLRACLPQHAEQDDNVWVVEGGVGCGAIGKHGGLLACARLQQAFQQPGRGARVIEGDAGGRVAVQQRDDLVPRLRRPQPFQQRGHGARVIEGEARDSAIGQRDGLVLRARLPQALQQPGHARGSSRGTCAMARSASAVACFSAPTLGRSSSR